MAKRRRGRPPTLTDGVERLNVLHVRVSDEELEAIQENAERCAMPVSPFLVKALQQAGVFRVPWEPEPDREPSKRKRKGAT